MKHLHFMLICTLVLLSQNAFAQKNMSLKDCVKFGLENDLATKRSTMELGYIKSQENEAYSNVRPQVNGEIKYQNNVIIPVQVIPAFDFSAFGLPKPDADATQELRFGIPNSMSAGVTVTQILYNHAVYLSVRAVRTAMELGQLGIEKAREQAAYNIAQAYLNLLVLRKQSQLLNINIVKLDKTIAVVQATVDNGFAKPIDVTKLKVAKNNLLAEVENLKIADEQLLFTLKFAMNMGLDEQITLTDDIDKITLVSAKANTKTIDAQLVDMQQRILGIQNEVVKSGYYPSAVAFGNYQTQAQRTKFDFFDTSKKWFSSAIVGVTINVPIYDGGNKSIKMQQNNIRIAQSKIDGQNLERAMSFQQLMAQKKIATLQNTLKTHQNNIDLANEVLSVTQIQQQAGYANATDIINAETAKREAEANYIKTLADVKLSELEVLKASGNMMETLK
jgi:outer membrane protein